ncbi:hypothetical protein CF327_g935 [Tilletia walkeri]|nr:hypothetical protein CF327_g935 [Tilletia walkeri]
MPARRRAAAEFSTAQASALQRLTTSTHPATSGRLGPVDPLGISSSYSHSHPRFPAADHAQPMTPTIAQRLTARCLKTCATTGTADVAARGRMHCVEAKDSQAGASRQQTTDFVRRRRARAARASDDKTSNATGKGISATRRSGRAIGRLGRQDAGHGTTRSTARTDWVGKGCQGTFPFPQLERQDGGRLGHDEKVMIKRDLSWTACLGRRDEDLGRPRRSIVDVSPGGISRRIKTTDHGLCSPTKGLAGTGTVPQDQHESGDGRRLGKRTDARRRNEGQSSRRVKTAQHGPCQMNDESRRTRATRNSDSKTNETVGKFRRQASPCGQRDNSDGKTQDAGREGMVSTRGVKASHIDGSSRWQDEDAARRLSATSRTRSTVKGRNEQRRRQTEILLRVGAPGSMSVTSLRRQPERSDEDLGRPRQTTIGVWPGRDKLSWA